jgi:hypothetical protein
VDSIFFLIWAVVAVKMIVFLFEVVHYGFLCLGDAIETHRYRKKHPLKNNIPEGYNFVQIFRTPIKPN